MRLSTRNQLSATITEVNVGAVMATVKVRLGLETGKPATILVKSTDVIIGVD